MNYVIAGYAVTLIVLGLYALRTSVRVRRLSQGADDLPDGARQ